MRNWIRRIRGGIGIGLTWAAGWMPIGAFTALSVWVILKPAVTFGEEAAGLVRFMWSSGRRSGAYRTFKGRLESS
jgi:hypothetical protein